MKMLQFKPDHLSRFNRLSSKIKDRLALSKESVDDAVAILLTEAIWRESPGAAPAKGDDRAATAGFFDASLSEWERDIDRVF